ncbi:lipocalin family protein [Flaviaesturariibacter aridisoli]|nr:lipocalin family protein [Flaviaesturariibacter aridisoli]
MKIFFTTILATLLLGSCTTTDNAKKIEGNWRGASWLRDGQPFGQDASAITFTFDANGNYTYTNSGQQEKGLYKLDDNNLYTTPAGGQDIMVKIVKLTADSLVFDMNRAGVSETMTLLRK